MDPNNPLADREKALENQWIREKEYARSFHLEILSCERDNLHRANTGENTIGNGWPRREQPAKQIPQRAALLKGRDRRAVEVVRSKSERIGF